MNERTIFFLSELEHINNCRRFLDAHPEVSREGYMLISLDAEIDSVLKKEGTPFLSGKDYRTPDAARMILAEEWTSRILENKRWSFFTYRGVSLGLTYFPQLQGYMNRVLYYTDIVANVVAKHPHALRLVVFSSPHVPPTAARCLTNAMIDAIADVVTTIAAQRGKEALVQQSHLPRQERRRPLVSVLKQLLVRWGFVALNASMMLLQRRRRIRILVSDYWRNVAPALQYLDSAEVICTDRKEALNAGLKNILKFRMRFIHLDALSPRAPAERKQTQLLFAKEWQSIQAESRPPELLFRGFSLQPLFAMALDQIVKESVAKAIKDIDDAHALLSRLKPDIVMLRATVSSQTHFSILAQVARAQGIPSLEMQHGLMYFGPGSVGKYQSAEYVGVYGPIVQREMKAAGYTHSTPIIIGSPRFDVYAPLQKVANARESTGTGGMTFLCIAPMIFPEESTDSYDVIEYFEALASALRKIPDAHAILKLRQGPNRGPFLRAIIAAAFKGIPHTIVEFEPLSSLFPQADIVVSAYSTAAIEALQCGKPLVYLGLCPSDVMTGSQHFLQYVQAGAMRIATSKEYLERILREAAGNPAVRKNLSEGAIALLKREYAFDGRASERTADFIRAHAN